MIIMILILILIYIIGFITGSHYKQYEHNTMINQAEEIIREQGRMNRLIMEYKKELEELHKSE